MAGMAGMAAGSMLKCSAVTRTAPHTRLVAQNMIRSLGGHGGVPASHGCVPLVSAEPCRAGTEGAPGGRAKSSSKSSPPESNGPTRTEVRRASSPDMRPTPPTSPASPTSPCHRPVRRPITDTNTCYFLYRSATVYPQSENTTPTMTFAPLSDGTLTLAPTLARLRKQIMTRIDVTLSYAFCMPIPAKVTADSGSK